MKISEDEIILLKNIVQKSQNNRGYIVKLKNGKTYIKNSIIELFELLNNQDEVEYIFTNSIKFREKELEYLKKNTKKDFKIYILKSNVIIEYQI